MQRRNVKHLQLRRFVIRNSKDLVFVFMIIHIRERERVGERGGERERDHESIKLYDFMIFDNNCEFSTPEKLKSHRIAKLNILSTKFDFFSFGILNVM